MRALRALPPALCLAIAAAPVRAQGTNELAPRAARSTEPPRTDNRLRDRIDSAVHREALRLFAGTGVVGMSIGVAGPRGSRTYGYGRVALDDERLPTAETRYAIASITKTFTATLLASAAVDGRLGLDDDVRRHLPGDYPNLAFAGQPIRLRHLVSHLSGLPRNLPDSGTASSGPLRGRLLDALHAATLDTVPGLRFSYSNLAAQLLGVILEDVYHQSYAQLVDARVAQPLRMRRTRLGFDGSDRSPVAVGYDSAGVPVERAGFETLQAAGALTSTVGDMLEYLRWHAAERDSAVRLTHAPTLSMGAYQVGLNWQMMTGGGRRTIWQDGGLPGYTSLVAFSPELSLRVVILSTGHDYTNGLSRVASAILTSLDSRAVPLP
jgi:CubicO group peptidase (beta-lactamase class C family)